MSAFRKSLAIPMSILAVAAVLTTAPATHAGFTSTAQCLSKVYGARGNGVSHARARWSQVVQQSAGGLWSDIKIAADYAQECKEYKHKTVCRVYARPCRPDDAITKAKRRPFKPVDPF